MRIATLMVALLAGCATSGGELTEARDGWDGATYDEVVLRWGTPVRSTKLSDGRDVYTWVSESVGSRGSSAVGFGIGGGGGGGKSVGTRIMFGSGGGVAGGDGKWAAGVGVGGNNGETGGGGAVEMGRGREGRASEQPKKVRPPGGAASGARHARPAHQARPAHDPPLCGRLSANA